jgi:hypothetical protein
MPGSCESNEMAGTESNEMAGTRAHSSDSFLMHVKTFKSCVVLSPTPIHIPGVLCEWAMMRSHIMPKPVSTTTE